MRHKCPACKLFHTCGGVAYRGICQLYCPKYGAAQPTIVYVRARHTPRKGGSTAHNPSSVDFYLAVRPLFETAYDHAGLGWEVSVHADNVLYRAVLRYGPSSEAIESVLLQWARWPDQIGRAVLSIEALLQISSDSDGDGTADDVQEELQGAIPVGAYDETAVLQAAIEMFGLAMLPAELRELVRPSVLTVYSGAKPSGRTEVSFTAPLECDLCLRSTHGAPLYRIDRHTGLEACYQCITHQSTIDRYNAKPYDEAWLHDNMRRY